MSDVELSQDEIDDINVKRIRNLASDSKAMSDFGRGLLNDINVRAVENSATLAQALWAHNRLRSFTVTISAPIAAAMPLLAPLLGLEIKVDILSLIESGNLPSAYAMLRLFQPDAMTLPYHIISASELLWIKNELEAYLGLPLTVS